MFLLIIAIIGAMCRESGGIKPPPPMRFIRLGPVPRVVLILKRKQTFISATYFYKISIKENLLSDNVYKRWQLTRSNNFTYYIFYKNEGAKFSTFWRPSTILSDDLFFFRLNLFSLYQTISNSDPFPDDILKNMVPTIPVFFS